jgi:hypothetical protein
MKINSVKLKYKQMKRLITSSLSILIAVIFIQGSIASVHGQQKKTTGEWRLEKKGSSLNFSFKIEDNDGFTNQNTFIASDFVGFKTGNNITFSLTGPAGKMVFKGDVSANQGTGTYVFTADNSFIKIAKENGFDNIKIKVLLVALFKQTPKNYFVDLKKLGYSDIGSKLSAFIALEITSQYIIAIKDAGYPDLSAGQMVTFRALGISPDYVSKIRKWVGEDLSSSEIIQYAALGVDDNYARKMNQTGLVLSPQDLVRFKALNIDPEYIASMRKLGFEDLNPNKITRLKGLNITPEDVIKIRKMGFRYAGVNEIVQYRAMGLTEEFVLEMNKAGYPNLTIHQLTQCKAMNINYAIILEAKDSFEGKLPEFSKLIQFAALRHTPGK